MSKNYTVIIGHARSGSTHLCQLVETLAAPKMYRELFHPNMPGIRRDLDIDRDAVLGHSDLPDTDQRMKIVQNPMSYLNRIAELNPQHGFIFKLFDRQLSNEQAASIIAESRAIIFLRRNLVHSYISNAIAREQKRYWGPTSTFLLEFNKAAFIYYCKSVVQFVKASSDVVRVAGVPSTQCWYDEIIDPDLGSKKVLAMLKTLGIAQRSPDIPDQRKDVTLFGAPKRQDYRQLASSKVSNPNEMLAALDELDLGPADDAFHRVDFTALRAKLVGLSDETPES